LGFQQIKEPWGPPSTLSKEITEHLGGLFDKLGTPIPSPCAPPLFILLRVIEVITD
jgi:hypothetical protein